MHFSKIFPHKSGYYWVVDTDYPQPFIAFCYKNVNAPCMKTFNTGLIELEQEDFDRYRFGDKIVPTMPSENTID